MLTTKFLILLFISSLHGHTLDFQLKETINLPSNCFTQGFIKTKKNIYLSCGKYTQSRLLKLSPEGKILQQYNFPKKIFAEGIAINDGTLVALSWKANKAFIFDADTLTFKSEKPVNGQGWGLVNYNNEWLKSDGSNTLQLLKRDSLTSIKTFTLNDTNGNPAQLINEMEICNNQLFANVWKSNTVLMFNLPLEEQNTAVGKIDISKLSDTHKHQGVANGIACKENSNTLWITGKNWGKAYAIRLLAPQDL